MAGKVTTDRFANIAWLTVTESAINTLTFSTLLLANNLLSEKAAIVIHRADLVIRDTNNILSSGDQTVVALTLSDRMTDIETLNAPEILFNHWIIGIQDGAATWDYHEEMPIIKDFSSLPGGGILVPADRLFLAIQSTGLALQMSAQMRIHYTVMPLNVQDYWELIEARRIMTT